MNAPYRMVVLDLDGTLLTPTMRIPPSTVAFLNRLISSGVMVVVASGRRFQSIVDLTRGIQLSGAVISNNGALIRRASGGELLAMHALHPTEALQIGRWFRFEKVPFLFTIGANGDGVDFLYDDHSASRYHEDLLSRNRLNSRRVSDLLAATDQFPILELYMNGEFTELTSILARLDAASATWASVPKVRHHVVRTISSPIGASAAQVYSEAVSKAAAVAEICRWEGVPLQAVVAIGDDINDREMIECAGLGLAMGNAVDEVKAVAHRVIGTNSELAVERALRSIFQSV